MRVASFDIACAMLLDLSSLALLIADRAHSLMPRRAKDLLIDKLTGLLAPHLDELVELRTTVSSSSMTSEDRRQEWEHAIWRYLRVLTEDRLSESERRLLEKYRAAIVRHLADRTQRALSSSPMYQ